MGLHVSSRVEYQNFPRWCPRFPRAAFRVCVTLQGKSLFRLALLQPVGLGQALRLRLVPLAALGSCLALRSLLRCWPLRPPRR